MVGLVGLVGLVLLIWSEDFIYDFFLIKKDRLGLWKGGEVGEQKISRRICQHQVPKGGSGECWDGLQKPAFGRSGNEFLDEMYWKPSDHYLYRTHGWSSSVDSVGRIFFLSKILPIPNTRLHHPRLSTIPSLSPSLSVPTLPLNPNSTAGFSSA